MTYAPGVWIDDIGTMLTIIGGSVGLVICAFIIFAAYFALRGSRRHL